MSGAFPCCDHCHADPAYRGSHATACGTKDCEGNAPTFVTAPRRRVRQLLALAAVLWAVAAVIQAVAT